MKPTFALDLSRDTVALLHRTPKGWLSIGEVAFDAPDLDEALDYLRKTALGLSPMGMACKVILPNSQILYTEITAPGPSRNDKRRQIGEALEGRTPYPIEDLVFDWSGKGATVKVAVVARETLREAEGFAMAHRLNPVSFVAIPPETAFVGEAWFGPTEASESLLAPGEVVDRDREAVTILQRDLPPAAAAAAAAEAAPVEAAAVETAPAEAVPTAAATIEAGAAPAAPEPVADVAEPSAPARADATVDPFDPLAEALADAPVRPSAAVAALPASVAEDPAEVALARALSDAAEPEAASPPSQPLAAGAPEVEEAPFAHVTDASAFPDGDDPAPAAANDGKAAARDDIPPSPSTAAIAAFASRRAQAPETRSARPDLRPDSRPGQAVPRPAPPKGLSGPVTAPSIPGTRARPKGKVVIGETAAATLGGAASLKSPARPGGTFGTAAPPRNRTGAVFLVLVALLLLFLAIIAAWSTLWLSRNGSTQDAVGLTVGDPAPGVDDEMLADMQDPEGMTAALPEAETAGTADVGALATEDVPVELALEAEPAATAGAPPTEAAGGLAATADPPAVEAAISDPAPAVEVAAGSAPGPAGEETASIEAAPEPEPAPEPAPGMAVATDVTAAQAPAEDQDEIFLAAMDAPPPALDALALPAPAAVADTIPEAAMPPPAFGTVYRFDANGLVVPTPEGILSPEGVLLFAGPPPRLPPARSETAAAAALAALAEGPAAPEAAEGAGATAIPVPGDASLVTATEAPAAGPAPADPAMAGFRPRPRPEGLATTTEDDAALTAENPVAVAGLRPLERPATIVAAAAAARPAAATDLGAQGASLAAQAEADLAAAAALEAQNPSIVAISRRPASRPRDLSRAVEAAVAAAVRAPDPRPEPEAQPEPQPEVIAAAAPAPELKPDEKEEVDEPEPAAAAPKVPTKASVAKQATFKNAINLSKINLIGTYGTESKRYALVRQANGRYKKVKVGDKIDGGTVKAITATEVRYQKGGKLVSLTLPKA
jgi:hypothetical protein